MSTMYDAVNASNIARLVPNAEIVAGYVDGHYAWTKADWALFPGAELVTITVFGQAGAHVGDCEAGNMNPTQVADWAMNEIKAGRRPTIYMSASLWQDVKSALASINVAISAVDFWVADYDNVPEVPAGAVAKQYQSTPAYDISITDDGWPRPAPSPPPPVPQPNVIQGDDDPVPAPTVEVDNNQRHIYAQNTNGTVTHWWQNIGTTQWNVETLPAPPA